MRECLYYNQNVQTIVQYAAFFVLGGGEMTAKEYLRQVKLADRRIEALAERRRHYRELAEARGGRSEALEALDRELAERIDEYAALVREIEGAIDGVGDIVLRDVLRYRYLNGWSWQVIAQKMRFSQDWLWRLHARALEAIGERDK